MESIMSKMLCISNEDVAVLKEYLVRPDTAQVLALVPSLLSALDGPLVCPPPVWSLQEAVSAAIRNTNYPEDYDDVTAWLADAEAAEWSQDVMLIVSDDDAKTLQRWTGTPDTAILYVSMPSLRDALVRPFVYAPSLQLLREPVSAALSNTNHPEDYQGAIDWLDNAADSAYARKLRENPETAEEGAGPELALDEVAVFEPEPAPAAKEKVSEPDCVCGGHRFAYLNSMARDCNYLQVPHLKYSPDRGGYLPRICPGFDGDGFCGAICLDCGRVQGKFPVSDESIEEALKGYRDMDEEG
jgi:hypothetical protein